MPSAGVLLQAVAEYIDGVGELKIARTGIYSFDDTRTADPVCIIDYESFALLGLGATLVDALADFKAWFDREHPVEQAAQATPSHRCNCGHDESSHDKGVGHCRSPKGPGTFRVSGICPCRRYATTSHSHALPPASTPRTTP